MGYMVDGLREGKYGARRMSVKGMRRGHEPRARNRSSERMAMAFTRRTQTGSHQLVLLQVDVNSGEEWKLAQRALQFQSAEWRFMETRGELTVDKVPEYEKHCLCDVLYWITGCDKCFARYSGWDEVVDGRGQKC